MYLIALLIAVFVVITVVSHIYSTRSFDGVEYNATLSVGEVFEDEDVFLYEEITNNKFLPLPCVRVDTDLPEGLRFRLYKRKEDRSAPPEFPANEGNEAGSARKKRGPVRSRGVKVLLAAEGVGDVKVGDEYLRSYVQSVFSLHSQRRITRRWRVACGKRGEYTISGPILVSTDPLGFNTQSQRITAQPGKRNTITVLPKPINLSEHFTSSYHPDGNKTTPFGLLSDPLRIAGSREYTPLDPMNKINWMSTASHGKLMVNIEEYAERTRFGLLLNMQSRGREQNQKIPSDTASVELCITVCASIFDMMSYGSVPVRLFANASHTDAGLSEEYSLPIGDSTIIRTPAYTGRGQMIDALRLLAVLPMKISYPTEKLLDAIIAEPYQYADGGNLIVVSSYIDERMINFHALMREKGVRVVFYITTANQNAAIIPNDVEIWYKTYL